ncbi:MAG TPA: protein kinase [Planctomycetota bacterium]
MESLPEPYRSALATGRCAEVRDAAAGSAAERYARGFARLQVGDERGARTDFEAARPELGDVCLVEIALLDIRERSALEVALGEAGEVLARAEEGSRLQARALHVVGLAQAKLRRNREAAHALLASLEIYRELDDRLAQAQLQDTLGSLYASKGRLDLATGYFALSLVQKTLGGDRYGMALTLGNLGRVHLRAGRYRDALDCFGVDLEMAHELEDRRGECRMHEDLGRARAGLGEHVVASECFRKAIELARKYGYRDLEFFGHKDLARSQIALGDPAAAGASLLAAERSLGDSGEPYLRVVLQAALGEQRLAGGDEDGLDLLEDSVREFSKAVLPDFEIPTLLTLADALAERRFKASAEACLRRALQLARADGYARYLPPIREATQRLALVESAVDEAGRLRIEAGRPVSVDEGYTILEKLGSGGFGDVWYALDHARDRYVAIKRLRISELYEGESKARALTSVRIELEAASRIRHAGVARVHAIGTDSTGETYLVQDFVDGISLRELLPEGPTARLAAALEGVRDIALSVAALAERGVVHRDLKPENVILRAEDGRPVLIDFGIAFLPSSSLVEDFVGGTLEYMAPEQASGKAVDGAADVYSLGVILFEWLAGLRPLRLREKGFGAALREIQEREPDRLREFRPDAPMGVTLLLGRMLAKKSASRPKSAEVAQECADLLADLRTEA